MKVFIEEQRFTQSWLILTLIISSIIPIVLVAKPIIESKGQDNNAIFTMVLVVITVVLIFVLIFSLKLKTRIDENGIYYRFIPFHFSRKLIKWYEIDKAFIRKYSIISEYGGWGIKDGALWSKSKGIAYNVKGDIGIQLVFKTGKKILIGTQKENEVNKVLANYKDKFNH